MLLTSLFFIVMGREQKWIPLKDQETKSMKRKQRKRTEARRRKMLDESKKTKGNRKKDQ